MAILNPFRGLRPPPALVRSIACLPYDVVNTEEARAYAAGNEKSFFHISRSEIGLPAGADEHGEPVYQLALKNLRRFQAEGWLRQDPEPLFYVYRQKMGEHVQTGLVAAASVDEYDGGLIKKHEHEIDAAIAEVTSAPPEYELSTEDGIAHTFWLVPRSKGQKIETRFRDVPVLYIADGHHRSAAASRVRKRYRELGRPRGGEERFLAVVFPHDQMQILPYNRVVTDLRGLTPAQFLEKARAAFDVEATSRTTPSARHQFGMFLDGKWYQLTAKASRIGKSPTGSLDVTILQENLLGPTLGIGDPRTDKRISFVGGIRGTAELERLVGSGAYRVAFSMIATRLEQLMEIADAGQIMPPKSTWFEPKLRSGLVLHVF